MNKKLTNVRCQNIKSKNNCIYKKINLPTKRYTQINYKIAQLQ